MPKIRVLIVDDAVVFRRVVADELARDPALEVVGAAANGHIALARMTQVNPDVVILDVEMPEMDGLATLKELRKTFPRLPVIMFSALTARGAEATLDALALGATDYFTKPASAGGLEGSLQVIREQLIPKIKALCARDGLGTRVAGKENVTVRPSPPGAPTPSRGPRALRARCTCWPSVLPRVGRMLSLKFFGGCRPISRCPSSSCSTCRPCSRSFWPSGSRPSMRSPSRKLQPAPCFSLEGPGLRLATITW